MSQRVLLLACVAGAARASAESWNERLDNTLEENPALERVMGTFLERLNKPYEPQPACWKRSIGRGRGLGRSRCDPDGEHPDPGGALCYAECAPGYTSDGVTLCWRSLFDVYSRGVGRRRTCQADEVEENALCYKRCPSGYVGVGPVCWQVCDGEQYPYYGVDGGAICCSTKEACAKQIFDMAVVFPANWARVVNSGLSGNYLGVLMDARRAVDGALAFALPVCGDPNLPPREEEVEESPSPLAAALSLIGAESILEWVAGDTCEEERDPSSGLTCAEAVQEGYNCAELVVAGYDCSCTCFDEEVACWKQWYSRGVGTLPHSCTGHTYYTDRGGALCYQPCKEGYRSDGASQCHKRRLWPPGGATVYSRGSGAGLGCAAGLDFDSGLCYQPCEEGYVGVGPLCWQKCNADEGMPIDGGAICCSSAQECGERIIGLVKDLPFAAADMILGSGDGMDAGESVGYAKSIFDAVSGYNMPQCALPGSAPGLDGGGSESGDGGSTAEDCADMEAQHVLQLLPAMEGSDVETLTASVEDITATLVAELAALLSIPEERIRVDLVENDVPLPARLIEAGKAFIDFIRDSLTGGGADAEDEESALPSEAVAVVAFLPSPDPEAPPPWLLAARLQGVARTAATGAGADLDDGTPLVLFDPATSPLLSRVINMESALQGTMGECSNDMMAHNVSQDELAAVMVPGMPEEAGWSALMAQVTESLDDRESGPSPTPSPIPDGGAGSSPAGPNPASDCGADGCKPNSGTGFGDPEDASQSSSAHAAGVGRNRPLSMRNVIVYATGTVLCICAIVLCFVKWPRKAVRSGVVAEPASQTVLVRDMSTASSAGDDGAFVRA